MLEPVTRRYAATLTEWDGTHGTAQTDTGDTHALERRHYQATPFTLSPKQGMRVELFVSYDEQDKVSDIEFRQMPVSGAFPHDLWHEHHAGECLPIHSNTSGQLPVFALKESIKFFAGAALGIMMVMGINGQSWAQTWQQGNFLFLCFSGVGIVSVRLLAEIRLNRQKYFCKIMEEGILFAAPVNNRNTDVLLLRHSVAAVAEPRRWRWLLGEQVCVSVYRHGLMPMYPPDAKYEALPAINPHGKTATLRLYTRHLTPANKQRLLHILSHF